jgi:CBS domain-containing protein
LNKELTMTTVRDIMTSGVEYLRATDTVADAAQRFATADIGALPVCEEDGHLAGMVTDRDIVVKVVARGKDPRKVFLGEIADQGEVLIIGAGDPVEEALEVMKRHKVRRLPVVDGTEVVGVVSQGDIARNTPHEQAGDLVAAVSS